MKFEAIVYQLNTVCSFVAVKFEARLYQVTQSHIVQTINKHNIILSTMFTKQ